jgi:hypothetical protein
MPRQVLRCRNLGGIVAVFLRQGDIYVYTICRRLHMARHFGGQQTAVDVSKAANGREAQQGVWAVLLLPEYQHGIAGLPTRLPGR